MGKKDRMMKLDRRGSKQCYEMRGIKKDYVIIGKRLERWKRTMAEIIVHREQIV
jgi:hypothetical protein